MLDPACTERRDDDEGELHAGLCEGLTREDALRVHAAVWAGFVDGARVWPTARPAARAYGRAVALRLARAAAPDPGGLRLDELYLAVACAGGDCRAIAAFECAFFDEIERAFSRATHGEAFLDDARQNLCEKLFVRRGDRAPEIDAYAGRGSLRTWLRVVIVHHTLNLRARQCRSLGTALDEDPAPLDRVTTDPELLYLRQRYAADFREAGNAAIARLGESEFAFLRHHYVERLNIDQIGAMYGMHRVTAARRLNRARARFVAAVREALALRLRVEATELESILRLLPTQVSLSLPRLLGGAGDAPREALAT